jgi:hypothetical protein
LRYSGGQPVEAGSIMALPARFSLLHSHLNDFLFAPVGEEQNGVTLSVVSALTRLGLDPWEQAARLTPLPKARAAEALATLIARLPIRRTLSSDDLAISQRLVELLPDQKSAPLQGRERVAAGQKEILAGHGIAHPVPDDRGVTHMGDLLDDIARPPGG